MRSDESILRASVHPAVDTGTLSRLNTLQKDTPVSRVLRTSELLMMIVDFFNADVNSSNKNKKALLALVTVNYCFYYATLDRLWSSVPSVAPFLRLLPLPFNPPERAPSKALIPSLRADPWSRFDFYSQRTKILRLTAHPEVEDFPTAWLFYLFQHPSRPPSPFPKLKQLTVSSMEGVNSLFAHQSLANLRTVIIHDVALKGREPSSVKHSFFLSLMTAFAANSPSLWKLTLKATLSKQMASLLPEMTSLTSLSVALIAPVRMSDLVFLNTLPHLATLSLATHGPAWNATFPQPGKHLMKIHPQQAKSRIKRLTLEGDPFFMFCAASFFCSPSLNAFSGVISSKLYPDQFPGLLLMPHILHLIVDSNPKVQEFSIEWNGTFPGDERWDWHDPRLAVPQDLGKALGNLHYLETLVIKHIPIITTDFIVKLLDALPTLPSLQTLTLVPRAVDRDDVLELPTMKDLISIRRRFPALRYLTLSMEDIPDMPSEQPEIILPGHPLETLFVVPLFGELEEELLVSDLIPLSTYLDRLFPHIDDVTSYFESCASFNVWRSLEELLKKYQQIRTQAVHQLQRSPTRP